MSGPRTTRKALWSLVGTAVMLTTILFLEETGSAFTSRTLNQTNSFQAAATFLPGTQRLNEEFSINQASGWGSNWTSLYASSSTSAVSGGVATVTIANSGYKSVLMHANTADYVDQGVYVRHRFLSDVADQVVRIGVRCKNTYSDNSPSNCTWAEFGQVDGSTGGFVASNTATGGAGSGGNLSKSGTSWWNYRVEIVGNEIRFKRWADGASEPSAWTRTNTWASGKAQTSGRLLFDAKYYGATNGLQQQFDDVYYYSL